MGGIGGLSPANKAFGVLNALGSVGFACELLWLLLCCRDGTASFPVHPCRTGKHSRCSSENQTPCCN